MLKRKKIIYPILLSIVVIISFYGIIVAEQQSDMRGKILHDVRLIVPGLGSNGMVIGEDIDEVVKRFGRNAFRISRPGGTNELFKQVFKVSSRTKIYFDSMYYNDDQKLAACVYKRRLVAVIGFDSDCITIDSVNIRNGINSYIFHYGNRDLTVIRSGSNGIYVYPGLGMAVADDGMNDTIDLFIVFTPRGVKK